MSVRETDGAAVFIDYENVHWGLRNYYHSGLPIYRFVQRIREHLPCHLRSVVAYADFTQPELQRIMTDLAKQGVQPRHVIGRDRDNGVYKNAADIAIATDMIELALTRDDIRHFVLVSGDGDYVPLIDKLHFYGCEILGIGLLHATSRVVIDRVDTFVSIEDLLGLEDPVADRSGGENDEGHRSRPEPSGSMPDPAPMLDDLTQEERDLLLGMLKQLAALEESNTLQFIGLGFFLERYVDERYEAQELINLAIKWKLIETYSVENPYGNHPTTACRLNDDNPYLVDLLRQPTMRVVGRHDDDHNGKWQRLLRSYTRRILGGELEDVSSDA